MQKLSHSVTQRNKLGVTMGMSLWDASFLPYVTSPTNCKAERMLVILSKAQLGHELGTAMILHSI